jgi:hypothetical protein
MGSIKEYQQLARFWEGQGMGAGLKRLGHDLSRAVEERRFSAALAKRNIVGFSP